ncbi:amino acid adenylation domain-containing protein, partial [Marinobacter sp. 71-i]
MQDNAMPLARRFLRLDKDKRRVFLRKLQEQGLDLSSLPIPSGEAGDCSPASFSQQRLWFIEQLEPGNSAYHLPGAVRLEGTLDTTALQSAFDILAERHHSLRTGFSVDGQGEPQQQILPSGPVPVQQLEATSEEDVLALARAHSRSPFDLERGPLWRVALVRVGERDHRLLLCLHHIIADGWSIQVLLAEFAQCYQAALAGREPDLAPLPLQYQDFALWQRRALEAGDGEADLAYWTRRLGDKPPVLELPADRPRPAQQSFRGARHVFALEPSIADGLRHLARSRGTTPFSVILAAYKVLLYRLSGQDDLSVGVPIAGRNRAETEGLIGFFVNTQVLRSGMEGDEPFDSLLERVGQTARDAQAHQALPFEHLVEQLQPERSLSHNPLFQVLYNHQQREGERFQLAPGLAAEVLPQDSGTAQVDLALHTWEFPDGGLSGNWNYATDLFDAATIERLHQRFERLLMQIVEQPGCAIGDYDLPDEFDRKQLAAWNDTAVDYGTPEPVQRLFERQANRHPNREALVFGDRRLSYAELDQAANRLAHYLIGQGVGTGSLVGVAAERSVEMVVALYAVMKAGAAYVPVDPEHPRARQEQVLSDAGVDLLLTHGPVVDSLPDLGEVTVLNLSALDLSDQPATTPEVSFHPEQRAYVIYTSGSTGRPKGVANTHAALYNRLQWMQSAYELGEDDTVLQKTPYSFDVSVWEFFWPLMVGARLVVAAPGEHREPAKLLETIARERVTTIHFVPSMLSAFLAQDDLSGCASLRRVVCSGEALPRDLQDQALERLPQANLYNLYGPTEAAIDVTHWTCGADTRNLIQTVPIGRPIGNLRIHILDSRLKPQPAGVPGELYIGGAGLALGYHGQPALTAQSFIPSPFARGERLYRSGDLAQWGADGNLEYLGRIDHQIKLRGLRIELGEIESVLRACPGVGEAVVIARRLGGSEQLIGYLQGRGLDIEDVRTELKKQLPDYMVPAHLVALEAFPLSANGKLDRKALPDPEPDIAEYEEPRGDTEQTLAALWQDVLGVAQVGRHDNFFALGGDSILSLRIIAKARAAGLELTPRDLFERQTVADLAQAVRTLEEAVEQCVYMGRDIPLTPIQHWFFNQALVQPSHWNQSLLLATDEPLDTAALRQALTTLVDHHDALRLGFREAAGQWHQQYRPESGAEDMLWVRDTDAEGLGDVCDGAQASLDIVNGPLLRAVQVRLAEGGERLLLVIHHLAVDGVSWRILLDDLTQAYHQARNGQEPGLGPKGTPFQAWSERLAENFAGEALAAERAYWSSLPTPRPLPCENPDGENTVAHLRRQTLSLPEAQTRELLEQAPRVYRTQINDLLLTALGRALRQWTGSAENLVALEAHGREDLFEGLDLSRTVGWFTSLYPVALNSGEDLAESLKTIKEHLRGVPNGGIGYGLLRFRDGDRELPDVSDTLLFNYLGQVDGGTNGLLSLAEESPGTTRAPDAPLGFELSLDGQVRNGRLELVCSYSGARHRDTVIEQFLAGYGEALNAILELCRQSAGLTPSDVPLAALDQAALDALPAPPREIDDILPLTPMQQGLLFHSELGGSADLYVNQVSVTIDNLPVEGFKVAWADAIRRHPILRAAFIHAPGTQAPLQLIHRQAELTIRELDWRDVRAGGLDALCELEKTTPFDLAQPPLMRLVLVRLDERRWQMVWTLHHILLDGWSSAALLSEILQQTLGRQAETPARYRDYFQWLANRDAEQTERFWRHQLAGVNEATRLAPLLAPRNKVVTTTDVAGEEVLVLDRQRLEAFARSRHLTLNTLVQAVWTLILQRYSGQRQVTFGATVAGRPAGVPGMERQLGLFINTLPVVQAPAPDQRVSEWLGELQQHNLALREHEHTPLYQIQRIAGQSGQELFDTLLVFENFPVDAALRGGGDEVHTSELRVSERTHYPLSVAVEAGDDLVLHLHYRADLIDRDRVTALAGHVRQLMMAICEQADQRIGSLLLLAEQEQVIWNDWNHPAHPPVDPRPIPSLIAEQARQRPDAIAVVHGEDRLTFAEFDSRANRLAHWLLGQGVGAESRVGVALERGMEMLVALYAVHKAGGVYLPLDPDYPAERVRYMLADSGASLLLSHDAALDRLPSVEGVETVNLDHLDVSREPGAVPDVSIHPEQLAYLIYTSGSTGKPKGVAVPHGALSMHCQTIGARYGLTPDDRELHFLSISFDGAHERWLTALSHGARIVLRDQALWSVQETYDCLLNEGITVAAFPPSYLRQLAEWAELKGQPPGVRIYCFAGEAFSRQM